MRIMYFGRKRKAFYYLYYMRKRERKKALTIFTSIVLSLIAPIHPVIATTIRQMEMKIIKFAGVKK